MNNPKLFNGRSIIAEMLGLLLLTQVSLSEASAAKATKRLVSSKTSPAQTEKPATSSRPSKPRSKSIARKSSTVPHDEVFLAPAHSRAVTETLPLYLEIGEVMAGFSNGAPDETVSSSVRQDLNTKEYKVAVLRTSKSGDRPAERTVYTFSADGIFRRLDEVDREGKVLASVGAQRVRATPYGVMLVSAFPIVDGKRSTKISDLQRVKKFTVFRAQDMTKETFLGLDSSDVISSEDLPKDSEVSRLVPAFHQTLPDEDVIVSVLRDGQTSGYKIAVLTRRNQRFSDTERSVYHFDSKGTFTGAVDRHYIQGRNQVTRKWGSLKTSTYGVQFNERVSNDW